MFSKTKFVVLLLGGAVVGPYLWSEFPDLFDRAKTTWKEANGNKGAFDTWSKTVSPSAVEMARPNLGGSRYDGQDATAHPVEDRSVGDLGDVLRMDISRSWVYARWPRKSTALSKNGLYGIRVPLVTGTRLDDLAGSLTYYFNSQGQVERLLFRGQTGDTRRLVSFAESRHGLSQKSSPVVGEELYQATWNGVPTNTLRMRPASILRTSAPHATFRVELELDRPEAPRYLADPKPR